MRDGDRYLRPSAWAIHLAGVVLACGVADPAEAQPTSSAASVSTGAPEWLAPDGGGAAPRRAMAWEIPWPAWIDRVACEGVDRMLEVAGEAPGHHGSSSSPHLETNGHVRTRRRSGGGQTPRSRSRSSDASRNNL